MRPRSDYSDVKLHDSEDLVYRATWPHGSGRETVVLTTRRLIRVRYQGRSPEERSVLLRFVAAVHDADKDAPTGYGSAPAVEIEHSGGRLAVFPGNSAQASDLYDAVVDAVVGVDHKAETD